MITIVVGAQWGDEGKGKWIDYLAKNIDIIARYQGGDNAGHTLYIKNKKYVFHLLPSGVLHNSKISAMLSGTVINPLSLAKEISNLNFKLSAKNLWISSRAHIITPYHIFCDQNQESSSDTLTIGTTKKGIGPTYSFKAKRTGLSVKEFTDAKSYDSWLKRRIKSCTDFSAHYYNNKNLWQDFANSSELIAKYCCDAEHKIRQHILINKDKTLLCEGAQGTLLDIDHGTYPFVTSSHTISAGALTSLGIGPNTNIKVIGITKAYCTRVGNGPFVTEDKTATGHILETVGKEIGATTQRKRRCGNLDLVALKYACLVNGFNQLIVNKIDVLSHLDQIKICISYIDQNQKPVIDYPDGSSMLDNMSPIYSIFASWTNEQLIMIKKNNLAFDDWCKPLKDFVLFIENYLSVKISFLGIGPERNDFIKR